MSKKSKVQERAEAKILELAKGIDGCNDQAHHYQVLADSYVRDAEELGSQIALLQGLIDTEDAPESVPEEDPSVARGEGPFDD